MTATTTATTTAKPTNTTNPYATTGNSPPRVQQLDKPHRAIIELAKRKQWLCWKLTPLEDGTVKKVPYNPVTGKHAESNNPSTWCTYEEARTGFLSGKYGSMGFALTRDTKLGVVDFDKVKQKGEPMPDWVAEYVDELDSYTEESCSGRGYHVLVWLPEGEEYKTNQQKQNVELWSCDKMFALSGKIVKGRDSTIQPRSLKHIAAKVEAGSFGPNTQSKPSQVFESSPKFNDLMAGRWESLGYDSQSEADLALCIMLAKKHGGDWEKIEQEFGQSGCCGCWLTTWWFDTRSQP
jgi:primase-polymerase (primpol)-like protein